jgi:Na+-translocating ferredoxin:NAD+ oxidoreductase subunit D
MSTPAVRFTVGAAPHWRTKTSITKMNLVFLAALLPTALAGAIFHAFGSRNVDITGASGPMNAALEIGVREMGVGAGPLWFFGILGTLLLGMGVGLLAEYGCQIAMRQPYHATNGHGVLIGLIMALFCPPAVPWWILVFGVFLAIFVGKQIFGGMGGYPMHPAMVGWLILVLSWQHQLYPVGSASIGAPHAAVIAITAIGGIGLVLSGYVRWQIPLGVLLGAAVATLLFGGALEGGILEQLFTGHLMLMAFFIGTDTTSSPANRLAGFLFGLTLGLLVMLIRAYGVWPDAVPFAVVLANVLNPLLDRIRPKVSRLEARG